MSPRRPPGLLSRSLDLSDIKPEISDESLQEEAMKAFDEAMKAFDEAIKALEEAMIAIEER